MMNCLDCSGADKYLSKSIQIVQFMNQLKWLTKKLIQAMRRRNAIYKQAKATNNYTKYRRYRNKVVGLLRNAKMAYFWKLNPRKSKEF